MVNITLSNIVLCIFFVVPGFVYSQYIKSKIPFRASSHFDNFVSCLIASFIINSILLAIIVPTPLFENILEIYYNYVSLKDGVIYQIIALLYCAIYIFTSMLAAVIYGMLFTWFVKKFKLDLVPVFLRLIPFKKFTFIKVTLKNKDIYTGQLKYYPKNYQLLTNSKMDIYIIDPYILINDTWKKLAAEGILLNTRDILVTEFNFKDANK
jgi:hypothetical protein